MRTSPRSSARLAAALFVLAPFTIVLGGSTPALAGCGGNPHQRDTGASWVPGSNDIVFTSTPQAGCGYFSYRSRVSADGGPELSAWTGALSPDGTRVAFSRDGYVHVAGRDGGGDLRLAPCTSCDDPVWTPDGKSIVFSGGGDLWTASATGPPARRLTADGNRSEYAPAVSPDGEWVAFASGASYPLGALEVIRFDGTGRRRLIEHAATFAWAPDSKRLAALVGPELGPKHAYLVDVDGTAKRLTASKQSESEPVFSSDGSLAMIVPGRPSVIRVFDAAGKPVARIAPDREPASLAWSPDGRRLAWAAFYDSKWMGPGLTIAAADGSNVRTAPGIDARSVAWSTDGTRLAVSAYDDACKTRSGIYVVDAATLAARRLTNDCHITGTDGDDKLEGTADDDVIDGLGGDDRIAGSYGNDTISGGGGNDVLDGYSEWDELDGGTGDDMLDGGGGRDTLTGGPGRDRISAGEAKDVVYARDGEIDTVSCGSENDVATVDPGDLVAGDCEAVLRTARDDYVDARGTQRHLWGGDGDDVLFGGPIVHGGPGNDHVSAGLKAFGGPGDDYLDGTGNLFVGGPGDDELHGWNGNDLLEGGSGNDQLYGGRGHDRLLGGPGDDVLNAPDRRRDVLDCGDGRDVAYADRSDVVRPNCERVVRRG